MTTVAGIADPNVGRIIANKFRIETVLGAGTGGTVYRASWPQLNRAIALKVLSPALAADPTAQARFVREAQAAAALDHPNSVKVYEHGTEPDGLMYLAMELLEGRDLSHVLAEQGPLPTERIARIMAQVLSVLAAAHAAGIVHRDLKPENIMLVPGRDPAGQPAEVVKVADFGIAKAFAGDSAAGVNLTMAGTVNGTPEYMSPEQARGQVLDGRSDLYSCGVILYEMLTGTLPFTAEMPLEILLKHVSDTPEPPSARRAGVDRRLEPVILRALAKEREQRYPDAEAMRVALLRAVEPPAPSIVFEAVDPQALGAPQPASEAPAPSIMFESLYLPGGAEALGGAPAQPAPPQQPAAPQGWAPQPGAVAGPSSVVTAPLGAVAGARRPRRPAVMIGAVVLLAWLVGSVIAVVVARS